MLILSNNRQFIGDLLFVLGGEREEKNIYTSTTREHILAIPIIRAE